MNILHIIYIGSKNSVRNVVTEDQFEKLYKPRGWQIDTEYQPMPEDENIKELKTATKIKNYENMKKVKDSNFDDDLFKKE